MDSSNPYQAPTLEADAPRPAPAVRSRRLGRAIGVFAAIWGMAAWFEWFLVPWWFSNDGGPVPHLAFAPQAMALFLGCILLAALSAMEAMLESRLSQLLYALPAASYVLYQVWRFF